MATTFFRPSSQAGMTGREHSDMAERGHLFGDAFKEVGRVFQVCGQVVGNDLMTIAQSQNSQNSTTSDRFVPGVGG